MVDLKSIARIGALVLGLAVWPGAPMVVADEARIAKTKAQKLHDQIAKLSDEDRAEYERLNAA